MNRNYIVIFSILFFSCQKQIKKNTIYGKIQNGEKNYIFLQKIAENGYKTIDSVMTSSDGSFEMKNPAKSPNFYVLRANATNIIYLVLRENETVEVNGNADRFELTYEVSGSKDSELIKKLRAHDKNINDSLSILYEKERANYPDKIDSIGIALQSQYSKMMENYSITFIKENMNSIVSLSATKFLDQYVNVKLLNELKDSLNKTLPDNPYVRDYTSLVAELNKMPPGSECPEINLNTPAGKPFALSSLRGKIVLIDFWASWCLPCRKENQHIVEVYNKLRGKDFEIFGVSLDENIAAWNNAIAKDKITWPQVSDLKRWQSEIVKQFHIEAIPFNILIDRNGKIISKGIRSEDLELEISKAIDRQS
jgi:thiol-disulfide isomerase/thioredoxin